MMNALEFTLFFASFWVGLLAAFYLIIDWTYWREDPLLFKSSPKRMNIEAGVLLVCVCIFIGYIIKNA